MEIKVRLSNCCLHIPARLASEVVSRKQREMIEALEGRMTAAEEDIENLGADVTRLYDSKADHSEVEAVDAKADAAAVLANEAKTSAAEAVGKADTAQAAADAVAAEVASLATEVGTKAEQSDLDALSDKVWKNVRDIAENAEELSQHAAELGQHGNALSQHAATLGQQGNAISLLGSDIERIDSDLEDTKKDLGEFKENTNTALEGLDTEKADRSELPDLTPYALKTDIPSPYDDTQIKAQIAEKADKSEIPDISGKADKSEIPSLEGYVKDTDYATTNKAGLVKGGSYNFSINPSGYPNVPVLTNDLYKVASQYSFVGKGTLENVLKERFADESFLTFFGLEEPLYHVVTEEVVSLVSIETEELSKVIVIVSAPQDSANAYGQIFVRRHRELDGYNTREQIAYQMIKSSSVNGCVSIAICDASKKYTLPIAWHNTVTKSNGYLTNAQTQIPFWHSGNMDKKISGVNMVEVACSNMTVGTEIYVYGVKA